MDQEQTPGENQEKVETDPGLEPSPETKKPCDPNDVICRMEVLRHLQGLEQQMGSEAFLEQFPEAAPLAEKIAAKVGKQKEIVDEALADCASEDEELVIAALEETEGS